MTELLTITVPGHITPQCYDKDPRTGRMYRPKRYLDSVFKIKLMAEQAIIQGRNGHDYPLAIPLGVKYTIWRCGRFDEDKLTGTIFDGLEAGGVVKNDCYLTLLESPVVIPVSKGDEKVEIVIKEVG